MLGELTRLGDVLAQAGRDYANISLSREADERNRSRQLEDRATADTTEERRFQRGVATNRADRKLANDEQFQAGVLQALVSNGFLQPADVGDPAKVAAAYSKAQQSGLIKRYEDLIAQGLLDPKDVGDQAKVNEALAKAGQTAAATRTNATAEATRLRNEGDQISTQIQQLETRLSEPVQQPTNAQVQARSVALAQQAKPGKTPSDQDIQAFLPQAAEELTQMAQQNKLLEADSARQQQQLLYNRLNDVQRRQENLETRFRVAPAQMTAPASIPTMAPAASAPRQATAEDRAAAMTAAIRATNPNPSTPPQQTALAPEFSRMVAAPTVAPAGRVDQAARLTAGLAQADKNGAQAELDQINQIIKANGIPSRDRRGGSYVRPLTQQEAVELQQRRERAMKILGQSGAPGLTAPSGSIPQVNFAPSVLPGTPLPPGKTPSYDPNPIFAPPNQTPSFNSRLQLEPAQ